MGHRSHVAITLALFVATATSSPGRQKYEKHIYVHEHVPDTHHIHRVILLRPQKTHRYDRSDYFVTNKTEDQSKESTNDPYENRIEHSKEDNVGQASSISNGKLLGEHIHEDVHKIVTIIKKVAMPYPVEKTIHYPVIKKVPYPVKVPIAQPYAVEKEVPYPVKVYVKVPVKIPRPIPVIKEVPYPVKVPVDHPVPYKVYIPEPYPVAKHVHYEVKVPVPEPFPIEKKIPVPVKVQVHVPQPFPVEKVVRYPVKVEVDNPIPIPVPNPYPVPVTKD